MIQGLDADVKHAFNSGFETFIAYMKAWSTVGSTGRLQLSWNANSAWDPLLELPVIVAITIAITKLCLRQVGMGPLPVVASHYYVTIPSLVE